MTSWISRAPAALAAFASAFLSALFSVPGAARSGAVRWTVRLFFGLAFLAVMAVLLVLFSLRPRPEMTIATWEGDYGHAQASAQIMPFGAASGINAKFALYDGGTAGLAQQVASHTYQWDVIDLELPDAVAACNAGLLEKLDPSALPAATGGEAATADFVPGAIGPCWVASAVYSQVIAYAGATSSAPHPQMLADFFDLARFPGMRALNRSHAKLTLEMTLLADGVAPGDVYRTLKTPQGMARAFAKLETLSGHIVWYGGGAEAATMLKDGRAAMAFLPNWAVFDVNSETPAHGDNLGIVWDRQLYELEVFGIPKGHPNAARAMDFIRFATRAENIARLSSWVPYGPARRSAVALVQQQPELHLDMVPYLPTTHFATAFRVDAGWWLANGAEVDATWRAWVTRQGGN